MLCISSLALLVYAAGARYHDDQYLAGTKYGADAVQAARSPQTVMKLHMMPDKGLEGMGAVCLDGSDAGFYFAPASSPVDTNNWQIYFQGGGWCYDERDCWGRSSTDLGSSLHWKDTMGLAGLLSDDCSVNPDFCNFNRVHLTYCDGFSFAGDRTEPLNVTGPDDREKPIYFRGRRIIDATLQTLLGMGLQKAEQVMVTGCSAGGLATYLHTDYVHGFLKAAGVPLRKFKAAPMSGFFLAHASLEGVPVYAEEIKRAYLMSNATGGLNARCVAAQREDERWQCSFAARAYAHVEAPIFALNSALDSWQTKCIFAARLEPGFPEQNGTGNGRCAAVPGWSRCSEDPEACNATQMGVMNQYIEDFKRDMLTAGETWRRDGNGAFIDSCHMHCEAQVDHAWSTIAIGGVTMQQALSSWWKSDSAAASEHAHTDCSYRTAATPHECNPTCSAKSGSVYFV